MQLARLEAFQTVKIKDVKCSSVAYLVLTETKNKFRKMTDNPVFYSLLLYDEIMSGIG